MRVRLRMEWCSTSNSTSSSQVFPVNDDRGDSGGSGGDGDGGGGGDGGDSGGDGGGGGHGSDGDGDVEKKKMTIQSIFHVQ